jgi:hypothetical protein
VKDLHQDLAAVHTNLVQAHMVLEHAAETVTKVNLTADTLNAAAGEERKNWQATSQEAAYTGRALRLLISRVDRSFVDGTLLHFNAKTLPAIDAQIVSNGDQLKTTIEKLGGSADGVTAVATTLNTKMNDPQIPQLLGHFNMISGNLEVISANSAAMSGDMKQAVHRLSAPPTNFHQFVSALLTAAKVGSMFLP